jgi:uncharacterized protein YjbI with pentapeptide repeats
MAESTDKPISAQDEVSRGAWTRRELGGKTVWDWLQLLIVPIMLSLITIAFTWQQDVRQQRIEDSRAERARKIEEQRAQQDTLRAYLDQMGTLLLDRDLHGADEDSDVRRLARARTLVVLDALGSGRQNKVFRFLSETELIQAGTGDRPPIISLKYASLRGFELQGKQLLENTDLTQARLSGADLTEAHLEATDLSGAHLEEANLGGASLAGASLSGAFLRDADLTGTDLSGADLTDADGRFESGARMNGTDLSGADLSGADLTNAEVTRDQLQRVASLEGATLPDGSQYES